ncbi:MAG: iron chaperone [Acidimicrobiales bacterium]
MSSAEVDQYLAGLEEPKRSTLQRLRQTILEVVPEAEEGISYQVPAFRVNGKVIAGFAAFKNHLSYLPHSGSVFPFVGDEVASYKTSKGALQFPVDSPLPKLLVERLIRVRMSQAFAEG